MKTADTTSDNSEAKSTAMIPHAAEMAALDILVAFNVTRWKRDIEKGLPETPNHLDLAMFIVQRFAAPHVAGELQVKQFPGRIKGSVGKIGIYGMNGRQELFAAEPMSSGSVPELLAFARLFASAPELLESLQSLTEWAEKMGGWESAVWDRARKAIAKATGE